MERIMIAEVAPSVDGGRWPVKRILGEEVAIAATIFPAGGTFSVSARVEIEEPGRPTRHVDLVQDDPGLDRWTGRWVAGQLGLHTFSVVASDDPLAHHRSRVERMSQTGRDPLDELDALLSLARSVEIDVRSDWSASIHRNVENGAAWRMAACWELLETLQPVAARLVRYSGRSGPWPVIVEHPIARTGAWYQFFPRSEGADGEPGNLRTALSALARASDMGFTVIYLPPIHPIGRTHRKGPDDSEVASPADPGSPWAIGDSSGGHDAVHPDLGTESDLLVFVANARERGLEVALDYALNCSPDHPWVQHHPEWFVRRTDGSFVPAGNVDKYYPDIYALDFDGPHATAIATACRKALEHWIDLGFWIFRVDLPHTRPLAFWERLFADLRVKQPNLVFLAEAFTKPTMMHWMSKVGFSQSLTYFLWRENAGELRDYLGELHGPQRNYLRPNLFVNSHDYLPPYLQRGGRGVFVARAAVASLASPSWGIYAGYELLENTPVAQGMTKYAQSEIYSIRERDWQHIPLAGWMTLLNRVRRENPLVGTLGNLRTHDVSDPTVVAFSRVDGPLGIVVIAGVERDTYDEVHIRFSGADLGIETDVIALDEVSGQTYRWCGEWQQIDLSGDAPVRIFRISV